MTNDCGVACLSMILKLFGKKVNLEELRKKVHIEKEGITAFEIIKIAKVYGLTAEGYKNYELINAKFPFIALLLNENNTQHFVVARYYLLFL